MCCDVGGDGFSDVHSNELLLQIRFGVFWCMSANLSVKFRDPLLRAQPHIPKEVNNGLLGRVAHASIGIFEICDELVRVTLKGQAFGLVHLSSR